MLEDVTKYEEFETELNEIRQKNLNNYGGYEQSVLQRNNYLNSNL